MAPRHLPLLALVLPACAASSPSPTLRPTQRFVLVTDLAALRTGPDATAPALGTDVAGPLVFRRVRARDGVVALETVAAPGRQCAATVVPPAGMRLRFVASTAALGQVLAETLHRTGPEGTLHAVAGTPVQAVPGSPGPVVVQGGLRVALGAPVPVTRAFETPAAERPVPRSERLRTGTRITLPEGAVATVTDDAPVLVMRRSPTEAGERVEVATPCVTWEAVVPAPAVLPEIDLELGDATRPEPPRWVIRAGARLRWPEGAPAGRTLRPVRVSDAGRVEGEMRCVRVPLRVQRVTLERVVEVVVCAAVADLHAADGVR